MTGTEATNYQVYGAVEDSVQSGAFPSALGMASAPVYEYVESIDEVSLRWMYERVINIPGLLERLLEAKQWLSAKVGRYHPEYRSEYAQACDEDLGLMTVIELSAIVDATLADEEIANISESAADWIADAEDPILRYSLIISVRRRS